MDKIFTSLAVSVDGFITGRGPGPGHGLGDGDILFGWYGDGDTSSRLFPASGCSSQVAASSTTSRGGPAPEATDKQTFITSIEAGIETARAAAGDRDIAIMGGVLPRLLSAAVWGEDPDLTPPRPPAYAEDGGDLCYVKDCGRAIALLMLAERLNHGTYNVSTGRLVRNNEVVAAINAAVPGADVALPEGRDPHRPPDNYLDTTGCARTPASAPSTTSSAPCRTTSAG